MAYNRNYNSRKPSSFPSSKGGYQKPAPVVKQPRQVRNWSQFQIVIFNQIQSGTGNVQVDALAGSGKTSTIVEGFYYLPPGKRALMCAFNKSIQTELSSRAPEGVEVMTLHSLGYRAVRKAFFNTQMDNEKLPNHIDRALQSLMAGRCFKNHDLYELKSSVAKCVSLAKGTLSKTESEIDMVIDNWGLDAEFCVQAEPSPVFVKRDEFIRLVLQVLESTKNDKMRIDFDDMVWFPVVWNLHLDPYSFVFIDEAQDLNKCQIELALKACANGGRIVSVGDQYQSIYQFRGAASDAIDNIVNRCHSSRLPLSVTYRCAKAIVEKAQEFVPQLEACEGAEEGLVETINSAQAELLVKPGDFIISRTNAPLISWCLALLRAGIPANIKGKDLGKDLLGFIKKSKASNVEELVTWVGQWRDKEVARLTALNRDVSIVNDKAECLYTLCEGVDSIADVERAIEKLFYDGDEKDRVMLSTTHKAKGLERERVFLLWDTYMKFRGRDGNISQEERNLAYVGITRAKKELYLISDGAKGVPNTPPSKRNTPSSIGGNIPGKEVNQKKEVETPPASPSKKDMEKELIDLVSKPMPPEELLALVNKFMAEQQKK